MLIKKVIIADSSDPVGPAETLFDPVFYEQMNEALNEGGIICAQGECFWTNQDLIVNVIACCADVFDTVEVTVVVVMDVVVGDVEASIVVWPTIWGINYHLYL